MATVLGHWGEPDYAETSLMGARMQAALGAQAELESLAINYVTRTVDVAVRLPDGPIDDVARDIRIARVRGGLADLIAGVFAEDELVLDQVHIVQADESPPQNLPIRPRRGDDGPKPPESASP